jgi:hypothetical protein
VDCLLANNDVVSAVLTKLVASEWFVVLSRKHYSGRQSPASTAVASSLPFCGPLLPYRLRLPPPNASPVRLPPLLCIITCLVVASPSPFSLYLT